MSEARINRISNEKGDGGPSLSGITTFSGLNYFVPPKGTTAERPSDCPPGSIRFNTDSAHLEYFSGLQWLEFEATNVEVGISTNPAGTSGGLGHRGLIGGGNPATVTIDYIIIPTLGNAQDFGDLTEGGEFREALSSSTRGVWGTGNNGPAVTNTMDFVTFSSTGDAINFGDIPITSKNGVIPTSNETRGLWMGGGTSPARINNIQYITIASTGDAVDFGDLTSERGSSHGLSSSTRGIALGGVLANPFPNVDTIDYVTIASTGDATNFGTLSSARSSGAAFSNSVRGIYGGGSPNPLDLIDFITIATLGNSQDFGDLTAARTGLAGFSSPTRGVFTCGNSPNIAPTGGTNIMDYITIASTGNAVDFGDNTEIRRNVGSCSNGHGGL